MSNESLRTDYLNLLQRCGSTLIDDPRFLAFCDGTWFQAGEDWLGPFLLAMLAIGDDYLQDLESSRPLQQVILESFRQIEVICGTFSKYGGLAGGPDVGDLPSKVFAGELPLLQANAQMCRVKDGYLLLFNTGFFRLLSLSTLIVNWSIPTGKDTSWFKTSWFDKEPPLAEQESARLIFNLLTNEDLSGIQIPVMIVKNPVRTFMGEGLLRSIITFALAHEYGHAYLYEYVSALQKKKDTYIKWLRTTEGLQDEIAFKWADELLADHFAMYVMQVKSRIALDENKIALDKNKTSAWTVAFDINAPLCLFALEEWITNTVQKICGTTVGANRQPIVDASILQSESNPIYVWADPLDKLENIVLAKAEIGGNRGTSGSLRQHSSHPYPSLRANTIRYNLGMDPFCFAYADVIVGYLQSLENHMIDCARHP